MIQSIPEDFFSWIKRINIVLKVSSSLFMRPYFSVQRIILAFPKTFIIQHLLCTLQLVCYEKCLLILGSYHVIFTFFLFGLYKFFVSIPVEFQRSKQLIGVSVSAYGNNNDKFLKLPLLCGPFHGIVSFYQALSSGNSP